MTCRNQGWSLALSPNGRNIATGLQDGSVEAFDAESGRRLVRFGAQSGPLSDVAFSMDGETIATAGEDGTIRLFSATTGAEELVLQGHLYLVSSMEFSATGGSSCPASADGTVRVWALDLDDLLGIAENKTRGLTNDECRRYLHLDECPEQ